MAGVSLKGIHNLEPKHPDRSRSMAARDAFAQRSGSRILSIVDAIVFRRGVISDDVKCRTRPAPQVNDTLLAATAIEHEPILATRSLKGRRHSGAALFNPWENDPSDFPLT
ncbi:plasmid stabilization protein [Sphingobium sp. CCH11-B1]|jgi:hypothetical protein|uniref:plasmid stabilization protein n=1 Tax=Sphingobium sp. CCH11-B1 TaxID=1768781 RepID=UPI0008360E10|nr:plasmid stabilization protein [Sphingobium sp. CCH11-B1]